jgi:tetratricopeptide (TPR) repeat protein
MKFFGLFASFTILIALANIAYANGMKNLDAALKADSEGNLNLALELADKAIKSQELCTYYLALAYYIRGAAFRDSGRYSLAVNDFSKAIELNSEPAFAYHARGRAWHAQGELELALLDFKRAIKLRPNAYMFFWSRSVVFEEQGDLKHAVKDMQNYLRADLSPADEDRGWKRLTELEARLANPARQRKRRPAMGPLPDFPPPTRSCR